MFVSGNVAILPLENSALTNGTKFVRIGKSTKHPSMQNWSSMHVFNFVTTTGLHLGSASMLDEDAEVCNLALAGSVYRWIAV